MKYRFMLSTSDVQYSLLSPRFRYVISHEETFSIILSK